MRSLNDTLSRLSALRSRPSGVAGIADRLSDLGAFGSNPGALRGYSYVPEGLGENAALVVVLHGCTQTAAGYDHGSGWSRVADDHEFALLFPEQQRANNTNLCFNWFDPADVRRGAGEALSIRQMVAAMVASHAIDPARIFVTGLSAGGAMTSVMLATYPDVFAGGAILAGLPYGTATSVPEAFDRMRAHGGPSGDALGALVTRASDHDGPWPTVSVWHGDRDATVSVANAQLIIDQWRTVHQVAAPPSADIVSGHRHRVWHDRAGRAVIEDYRIAGMGHGTPLATQGADACGSAMPYMLEAGISSTRRIAAGWDLGGIAAVEIFHSQPIEQPHATPEVDSGHGAAGVGRVIEDALRAAGLMR